MSRDTTSARQQPSAVSHPTVDAPEESFPLTQLPKELFHRVIEFNPDAIPNLRRTSKPVAQLTAKALEHPGARDSINRNQGAFQLHVSDPLPAADSHTTIGSMQYSRLPSDKSVLRSWARRTDLPSHVADQIIQLKNSPEYTAEIEHSRTQMRQTTENIHHAVARLIPQGNLPPNIPVVAGILMEEFLNPLLQSLNANEAQTSIADCLGTLASNQQLTEEQYTDLIDVAGIELAGNPATPDRVLIKLAQRGNSDVIDQLSMRVLPTPAIDAIRNRNEFSNILLIERTPD